jgi:hypothetical protein
MSTWKAAAYVHMLNQALARICWQPGFRSVPPPPTLPPAGRSCVSGAEETGGCCAPGAPRVGLSRACTVEPWPPRRPAAAGSTGPRRTYVTRLC